MYPYPPFTRPTITQLQVLRHPSLQTTKTTTTSLVRYPHPSFTRPTITQLQVLRPPSLQTTTTSLVRYSILLLQD